MVYFNFSIAENEPIPILEIVLSLPISTHTDVTRNTQIRRRWRSSRPLFFFATFTSALGVGVHFLANHQHPSPVKSTETQTVYAAKPIPAAPPVVANDKPLVVELPPVKIKELKKLAKRPPRTPRAPKKIAPAVAVAAAAIAPKAVEASTSPVAAPAPEPLIASAPPEFDLEVEAVGEQAIDTTAPLDSLVAEAFVDGESDSIGMDLNTIDAKTLIAAVEGEPHVLAANEYHEKVGLFQKTDFGPLGQSLDQVTAKASELEWVSFKYVAPKAPVAETDGDKLSASKALATTSAPKALTPKPEPELVRPKATAAGPPIFPKLTAATVAAGTAAPSLIRTPVRMAERETVPAETAADSAPVRAETSTTQREWSDDEYAATSTLDAPTAPTLVKPTQTNILVAAPAPTPKQGPVLVAPKKTAAAPAPTLVQPLVQQPAVSPTLVVPNPASAPAKVAMKFSRAPSVDEAAQEETIESPRVVIGHLVIDRPLREEIESRKGHIELRIHPEHSRDPIDSIRLDDYQYPDEEFEIDVRLLKGTYRVIALIFVPGSQSAIARLVSEQTVSAEKYKEQVWFPLKWEKFLSELQAPVVSTTSVGLTMSVFKWMSGNSDTKIPLTTAKARILGMPEYGLLSADTHGDIRIPRVPTASELLMEVQAPGFYPSYQIVPTFGTHVYHTTHLVERDMVGFLVSSFLKATLKTGMGTLLGRTFDTESKQPLAGEQVSMWFRKGKALYFDTMPDTQFHATTKTGLFGFFNVMPAFRFLSRGESKPPYMVNVQPDSAQYVELGRGGKKSLRGRVRDPFAGTSPGAKIRLVGSQSSHYEVETDRDGNFEIPDIDFPPGQVTLEVEAPGYRTALYNIPWSTREPEKVHDLFVIDKELLVSSASMMGRTKLQRDKGHLIGGADPSLLAGKKGCVQIVLERMDGTRVGPENGPFPLLGGVTLDYVKKGEPMCLTPGRQGFAFFNLVPGVNYILKWVSGTGRVFRGRVVQIGVDRDTIAIN